MVGNSKGGNKDDRCKPSPCTMFRFASDTKHQLRNPIILNSTVTSEGLMTTNAGFVHGQGLNNRTKTSNKENL